MNSSTPKVYYGVLLFNFWWMYKYIVNNGTLHPLILIILMFLFAIQNYLSNKN